MSSNSAKHRKSKRAPSRNVQAQAAARSRHRKPSPIATAIQTHPTRTAAAVTGAVLLAAAAPAASHWSGDVGVGQAAVLSHSNDPLALNADASLSLTHHQGSTGRHAAGHAARSAKAALHLGTAPAAAPAAASAPKGKHHRRHHRHHHQAAPPLLYQNPLRAVAGLVPERVDQGVDFSGSGPVYPIGDAVITNAQGDNYGWPGGGWITYRLTDGPAAGLYVFVAEDVTPTVAVGQTVTPDTPIATMYEGGAGIETGWSMPSGFTAESQAPEAGGISGAGPFPTQIGTNFDELLQALGVPAAPNRYDYPSGILPAGYSPDWAGALH